MKEKVVEKLLVEFEKHKRIIEWAVNNIKAKDIYPFTPEILKSLDESSISLIDTVTFRFSKLQETLGNIFWELLSLMGENTDDLTFLDVLNKMERYRIINSAFEWQELRRIRNIISHEYETDYNLLSENLNLFLDKVNTILEYYESAKSFYKTKIRS